MCVCVCVCVCEREREREREGSAYVLAMCTDAIQFIHVVEKDCLPWLLANLSGDDNRGKKGRHF